MRRVLTSGLGVVLLVMVVGSCSFDQSGTPDPTLRDAWISDGPVGDAISGDTGIPAADADAQSLPCNPGDRRCVGDALQECAALNQWNTVTTCQLGCDVTATRCSRLLPSNGIDPGWLQDGLDAFAPTTDVLVNTGAGTITPFGGQVVFRTVGPHTCGLAGGHPMEMGVFIFTSIHIPTDVTVRIRGTRAAVFLSADAVLIEGIVDVSGGRGACDVNEPWCAGPGGFTGGLGNEVDPDPGEGPGGGGPGFSHDPTVNDETGGGGGGHGGGGGAGGNESDGSLLGGLAGATYGSTTLTPLCGGSGGGGGGGGSGSIGTSSGGGGGGAFQLVSGASVDLICGTAPHCGIGAAGGGGQADHISAYDDGGGGGGAGGSILVEAPAVFLGPTAVLAAGGGGGAGGYVNGGDCHDGEDGPLSESRAAGGPGNYGGGAGGGGSTAGGDPGDAGHDGTAGGGGGAGRIAILTYQPYVTGGLTSPDLTTGLLTIGAVQTD